MDEIESRISSYEMALIEVAAHIDQDNLIAAMWGIRSGPMEGIQEKERVIRLRALELLELALERADIHAAMGLHWHESPQGGLDAVRMLQERLGRPHPSGDD